MSFFTQRRPAESGAAGRAELLCAATVALFLLASPSAHAQHRPNPEKQPPASELVIEDGSSIGNIHVFAYADDRRINPIGIEYDRHSWGGVLGARVDYVAEFLPVVLLNEPAKYGLDSRALTTARQTHYGVGFSPIGVRLLWRRHKAFNPYLIGKGGLLYFTDHVLSAKASRLNFSAQFGGGVETTLPSGMKFRLGYSDFHFSNGDISQRNPGIDFMYVSAGLGWQFGGR